MGYVGNIPGLPYESLAIADPLSPDAVRAFAAWMWPATVFPEEAVLAYTEKLTAVEAAVRRMVRRWRRWRWRCNVGGGRGGAGSGDGVHASAVGVRGAWQWGGGRREAGAPCAPGHELPRRGDAERRRRRRGGVWPLSASAAGCLPPPPMAAWSATAAGCPDEVAPALAPTSLKKATLLRADWP
ncbi:Os06g0342875 [Oryza sativa Japonica Group]|nr:Os06g0342875 [Oryza sativa Japonica Group]